LHFEDDARGKKGIVHLVSEEQLSG